MDTFSQVFGNREMSPKKMMIAPETNAQTSGGILMKAVDAFNSRVKTTIATAREPAIMSGRYLPSVSAVLPTMIGKSGSVHGARTVRTPARNERRRKVIAINN